MSASPHFDDEIHRLADAARIEHAEVDGYVPVTERRKVSRLMWFGAALIVVELACLAALFSAGRKDQSVVGHPVDPMAGRTDCEAVSNRVYWKVATYLRDRGKTPAALSDLVGSYIDKLPSDPATGKPLLYSTDGEHFSVKCPR